VRMKARAALPGIFLAVIVLVASPRAAAQNDEALMPDQSAAKAKQLLQQAIQALGGSAYLNVRDVTCTGRLGQFGHSGDLNGFAKFIDYAKPPDKDRTENLPKQNIITVMNGNQGWSLDRGGVSEASVADVAQFQEDTKTDIDYILRHRLKEPDMILRYAGGDVVDLHEAEWVELIDSENRTIRIAFDKSTHLPLRKVITTRAPVAGVKWDVVEYYSNYHPISGIQTPFQIARERNSIKVYQVFFEGCSYNTNVPDSYFTKESLDERWAKVAPKGKKKKDEY
jgi:outer membrane lipoprotein-sorting protein